MLPQYWDYVFILATCLNAAVCETTNITDDRVRKFPDGFLFGAGTSSYQIEGAWNEDGKTPSIWDILAHRKPCVLNVCETGDVAADSYHHVERDVEMMRELGLDYYRFSISWPRILPSGYKGKINEAGVQHYNKLINEMLKYNIKPMVTLYHYELPQILQDMGGWTNPLIVNWFSDYAHVCYELFGDRVKNWNTINEPHEVCYQGYGIASQAPWYSYEGYADYLCTKYVYLAHAKAYRMYDKEFKPTQKGVVGILFSSRWFEPESDNPDVVAAAEEAGLMRWGMYLTPIFSEKGDYPDLIKNQLPPILRFTPEEVDYIRGTADYLGLNHYTSIMVSLNGTEKIFYQRPEWECASDGWIAVVPWGFYKLLKNIKERFNNPPIYIVENGYPTKGGLEDEDRVRYIQKYLGAMLDAIEEGCDIRGFTVWSLMDSYEWLNGYSFCFGLYEVDFSAASRARKPRNSAFMYKRVLRSRSLETHYNPATDRTMIIDEGH